MTTQCKDCGDRQSPSAFDRAYLELFGTCWACDRLRWLNEDLSLEVFERRERMASDEAINLTEIL